MNINSINRFNNYANRPAFGRGRGDGDTYYKDYTDHSIGGGAYVRVPAQTFTVLDHGGLSGRQMTAAQIERGLRESGQIREGASRAEVDRAIGHRIGLFKK
ncbi:MAG: hypothetical protein IKU37_10630 [Candidatus Gastranaerophilales bacterium]|nr:hypothetical protein [Candidatus Gastranaerophilales bacterium]